MTRENMINYMCRIEGDWFKDIAEGLDDDNIEKGYNRMVKEQEILADIYKNGITTYRIGYKADDIYQKRIKDFMIDNNMYCYYEGKIKWEIRVGNYCIVGVPEEFIPILEDEFEIRKDLKREILSEKDFADLKVSDKVVAMAENMFGGFSKVKGTIHTINDNSVLIRLYNKKRKGVKLYIGGEGSIKKIKSFKDEI